MIFWDLQFISQLIYDDFSIRYAHCTCTTTKRENAIVWASIEGSESGFWSSDWLASHDDAVSRKKIDANLSRNVYVAVIRRVIIKIKPLTTSITFAFSLHRPRVLFLSASLRPSVYNAKTSSPYAETERERDRVNINTLLMDREFNTQVPSSKCHISKGSRVDLMLISREELSQEKEGGRDWWG